MEELLIQRMKKNEHALLYRRVSSKKETEVAESLYLDVLSLLEQHRECNKLIAFQVELTDPYPFEDFITNPDDPRLHSSIQLVETMGTSRWCNPVLAVYPESLLISIQPNFLGEYVKVLLPFVVAAPGSGYSGHYYPYCKLNRKILLDGWRPELISEIWEFIERSED